QEFVDGGSWKPLEMVSRCQDPRTPGSRSMMGELMEYGVCKSYSSADYSVNYTPATLQMTFPGSSR
ncbi:hypothetical protein BGX27_005470, partial [Mortierella sp. AM989]